MARYTLFRKNIEPRCAYCARANTIDDYTATCRRKGIVSLSDHCRLFKYDPLRRIPPRPAVLRGTFTDADFMLEVNDEE